MFGKRIAIFLAAVIFSAVALGADRPNIVFILADDLGYGELGCFGQKKIHTPNIDRIAAEGVKFTSHYAGNAVCAPSRCVLLTGKHPGHAYIRDNRELKGKEKLEGQIPLPEGLPTIATYMKEAGYATGGFGKWGLGGPESTGEPWKHGFDTFLGYLCQYKAHNFYPLYIWSEKGRVDLNNPDFSAHQKLPADADPNSPASYAGFSGKDYAPDKMLDGALSFISANKDRPFYLYFPTTIPHLALQVPEDSLAEYAGKLGEDAPYTGNNGYLPNRTPHATYAAMISRLDGYVGKMMERVASLGLDEKTIFIFTSDNGPTYERLGGTDSEFFDSAAGFRGLKGSLYEGGYRVPLVVRWKGQIKPGRVSDRVTGFEDWLPTLLEFAGAADKTPKDTDGISFAREILGQPQPEREFLYREFPSYTGQQCVRCGPWKGIRQKLIVPPKNKNAKPQMAIELYNLDTDPGEKKNVATDHADIIEKMTKIMDREHVPSPEFPFPALDKKPE